MRVLVTGATGFVGRALVPALLGQDHSLLLLTRRPPDLERSARLDIVIQDLGARLALEPQRERIDAIIHLAQAGIVPDSASYQFSVNAGSTVALLEFGKLVGIRKFVLASSGSVYRSGRGPYNEQSPLGATDPYAASKIAAEAACEAFSRYFDVCVLRLFQPYGPGQRSRLIPRLAERLRRGQAIELHTDDRPTVSPSYIADVVHSIGAALSLPPGTEVINVAGDEVVSIRELACMVAEVLGVEPRFEHTGRIAGDLSGRNARMRAVLGVPAPVRLLEGLASTFVRSLDEGIGSRAE